MVSYDSIFYVLRYAKPRYTNCFVYKRTEAEEYVKNQTNF